MRVVELSGGVGGARLARGLAAVPGLDVTIVVNVGDDEEVHGLHVAADLDTVLYHLAGVEGPQGWGRAADTFHVNQELGRFGVDNEFRLGDLDLALNIHRTQRLRSGQALSTVTDAVRRSFGVTATVVPVTDDPVRTEVRTDDGWLSFQDYFVRRGHRDRVLEVRFAGAEEARPAPGVAEALASADIVVIGPSNPPLSIWPILAVPGIRTVLEDHPRVVAVSPLIGGRALKGPAAEVMASLGLPAGNLGVAAAYEGLIGALVVDISDSDDLIPGVSVIAEDTRIPDVAAAARLARAILVR